MLISAVRAALNALHQDVPYVLRSLRKAPGFSQRLRELDPRLPLSYSTSLRQALDDTVIVRKAITVLQATFAGSALLLSLVGVFAVLASSVVERRRELGIRIAVGAHRSLFVAAALVACFAPARHAAGIDPLESIRA